MNGDMDFAKQKSQKLNHVDLSRKGSVDKALKVTVELINTLPQYFTTSSCSGRIILFENESSCVVQKKGCKWLHVSHDLVSITDIVDSLKALTGEAVFKFEPMIMHVQCQTIEAAQKLHQAAVAAGFRNSGITVGKNGKIMMAVRGTHSLEAPLSTGGEILVSQQYLQYLTQSANAKMEENFARIDRFHQNIQLLVTNSSSPLEVAGKKQKDLMSVRKKTLATHDDCRNAAQKGAIPYLEDVVPGADDSLSLFMFVDT